MEEYQIKRINKYRRRKVFSLFGFIIVNGVNSNFIRTNKWFKFVTIKEQKIKERCLEFDDGWTYQCYWGKWKESWEFRNIVD